MSSLLTTRIALVLTLCPNGAYLNNLVNVSLLITHCVLQITSKFWILAITTRLFIMSKI